MHDLADLLDRPSLAKWGKGRCINCGFLAKKDTKDFMVELHSVSVSEREAGEFRDQRWGFQTGGSMSDSTLFAPFCAKRVISLSELAENDPNVTKGQHGQFFVWSGLSGLIQEERECPMWFPWREGFTPKEHLEEFQMRLLGEQRRAYEEGVERKRRHFEWILLGVAVGVSLLGLVAQIIAQALFSTDVTVIFR